MGKTKIKTIDDSTEIKKEPKKLGRQDELVEKLKAELEDVGQPPKPISKIKHPTLKKIRSKKYQAVVQNLDRNKTYPIPEAIDMVKKLSYSKFPGTLEAHINTAQTGLRGTGYKTEPKAPIIHLGLGKLDQPTEQLIANIKTLLQTLGKTRIKKVSLSPTMGPSVKLDLSSL